MKEFRIRNQDTCPRKYKYISNKCIDMNMSRQVRTTCKESSQNQSRIEPTSSDNHLLILSLNYLIFSPNYYDNNCKRLHSRTSEGGGGGRPEFRAKEFSDQLFGPTPNYQQDFRPGPKVMDNIKFQYKNFRSGLKFTS